jgi:hypothetical protein
MNEIFVVQNQLGQYWGKKKKWADGTNPRRVHLCKHQDEAVNLLVELSARDVDLRGEVLPVEATERGVPIVEPSEHLLPEELRGEQLESEEVEPGDAEPSSPDEPISESAVAISEAPEAQADAPAEVPAAVEKT